MFSIKMRAAQNGKHLSGAECLLPDGADIAAHSNALLARALDHSRGAPDEIHLTLRAVDAAAVAHLSALPVREIRAATPAAGRAAAAKVLAEIGVPDADALWEKFRLTYALRGALLLNIDTGERLEPKPERGIRATCLDAADTPPAARQHKNHFREALILATKVANAPGVVAEICVSDDPDYVAGYVASRASGYVRVTPLKERGSADGGRIFLFRGDAATAARCVEYLERTPVMVSVES
ncbi:6-carboxyhexanoate--CoA ligase [Planctomycetales bacterium]|nr:6-carboxyhexanoate--CoA ligase [Planctomycetales bacterium]GHS98952.1 6-carboxyhexanoate--CoA ligase [Planctomycetales bacterium]GHT06996.1 6-carboxyhexanoate--CoA ligase [Planctomycetales bacterium]